MNFTLLMWSDVGPELGLGLQRVQMGHNLSQGQAFVLCYDLFLMVL